VQTAEITSTENSVYMCTVGTEVCHFGFCKRESICACAHTNAFTCASCIPYIDKCCVSLSILPRFIRFLLLVALLNVLQIHVLMNVLVL